MKYILHGDPIALQRPRFIRGYVVDFQSQEKMLDGIQIRKQYGLNEPLIGPIMADITFFMRMPKSYSDRKRDRLRDTPHYQKPDLDNMIKYILDVCNGILYKDDALISEIHARKIWADLGKTEITLEKLNESEDQ